MKKGTKLHEEIMPIKSKRKLELFSRELLNHGKSAERNYVAWVIGVDCLLRVSDIIKLKYNQIFNRQGQVKSYIETHDKKTKKFNPLYLNNIKSILFKYRDYRIKHHVNSLWMFPMMNDYQRHVSRTALYNAWKRVADFVGVTNFSTHTARKTGAYLIYKANGDISQVQSLLHHSKQTITLRYLGINSSTKIHQINHGIKSRYFK